MRSNVVIITVLSAANAFVPPSGPRRPVTMQCQASHRPTTQLFVSTDTNIDPASTGEAESSAFPPILNELRDVAMKLHTREQAPRDGQAEAPAKPAEPYVPTQADYLQFLVDSNEVYVALEEIVSGNDKLTTFRNSGLERTIELEKDIAWMCNTFDLDRPDVGIAGQRYAEELRAMVKSDGDIPEFMCHYYNYYFAHLAGGRMIGKSMSKLLLDGETLEFYKVRNSQYLLFHYPLLYRMDIS